ncbi:sulfite exporter TauE/SafE family protein [Arenibacter sp. BSSL-BM3]|uniref:Sulfite exporter TauE/SafE family protein n=1 Tax=Arenibacter arenosicollis TaxID=2762274 RepID=A0ABR7QMZ1_9FLAO|nr:sulfite exporter TauE/SafE family protein [Arenibacter arenosicollis]MBC8768300.1 sulfite exporter TauE/SafE family protein [Arenibacter arenosicollis]
MLLSALIMGLMGSFHCIGMCGPIAFMLPVDHNKPAKKLMQVFLYHLGRLTSYSILGLIFGFLGKGLYVFGMQQRLSIIIGVLMITVILIPYKTFNKYNFSKPIYSLLSKVKSRLGKELQKKSPDTFLTIGLLNGLLPCGLVYIALFGSIATASPWLGALFMVLFGVGTIPLMTSAVYFGSMLKGSAKKSVQRLIPVFVVLIGLLFILRGMGLGIPYISPEPVLEVVTSTLDCH